MFPAWKTFAVDVSNEANCHRVCRARWKSYNLAADMAAWVFIERFRVECLRSILINTHMVEAAYKAVRAAILFLVGLRLQHAAAKRPEGACAQGIRRVSRHGRARLRLEKLISEMFCEEYWHERGMKTFIARFHNVYGPNGTWDAAREKPRRAGPQGHQAIDTGSKDITIWGDGSQTRSFMYIDDCVKGIDMITHCDDLIATPINLGSSELVSINELLSKIEKIAA